MIKNIITIPQGPVMANTYIVCNEYNECLIIDLGEDISNALNIIKEHNLKVINLLLTHGHFDHIMGVKSAVNEHIGVLIGEKDAFMLESKKDCLATLFGEKYEPIKKYEVLSEGEYKLGNFKVKVIETPGHTTGSVCYVIDDCIFTGDTLFKGGYGRCDLPYGNAEMLKNSLVKILSLPNLQVYPGHGDKTTINEEKNLLDQWLKLI